MVTQEEIKAFLEGNDPEEHIVAIEYDYASDAIYKIKEIPGQGKIIKKDTFTAFAWVGDLKDLNFYSKSKDLQKEATAQAELYALQEKSATDRRAIRKTEIRADKEEQARLKAIATERNEIAKSQKEAEKTALKDRQDRAKLSFENEKSLVDEQLKNTKISRMMGSVLF